MRIIVDGEAGGEKLRYTFDLYDEYCHDTGIHSMARTTGYTATTALRLLAENIYMETGITLGEKLGEHDSVVEFMLEGLRQRGVNYESKIDII